MSALSPPARRRICPTCWAGLIGPGGRKSMQPMPAVRQAILRDLEEPPSMRCPQCNQPLHTALLRKWPGGQRSPFPGFTYSAASVTGMPSGVAVQHGGDVRRDLRAGLPEAVGVLGHEDDVDPAARAVALRPRRDSTRSLRWRIAGISLCRRSAMPPECIRGAAAKAMGETMREDPANPTMPPACRMFAKISPAPRALPDR